MMPRKKKTENIVEAHGIRVRLFLRSGLVYRDVIIGRTVSENGKTRTQHDIKSLKTDDWDEAKTRATELCKELAKAQLLDAPPADGKLTLGHLFGAYRRHRLAQLQDAHGRAVEAVMSQFTDAWGEELPVSDIDQTRVTAYCAGRRDMTIVAPVFKEAQRRRGYRTPQRVRDGKLDLEFRILNAILNWACGYMQDGNPLLTANPLPREPQKRRALGWPLERNPRRPVAAHDRYVETQKHTDAVDPQGRLRAILAIARYTGRRESAICSLQASDVLLSPARIRQALADAGLDEADWQHMEHGALRWRDDFDKVGLFFITGIGPKARAEIDRYLRANPRMGDVPLFPAPGKKPKKGEPAPPERTMPRERAAKWLLQAERRADLPKMRGGVFHCYRRLWAIERQHMPAVDVAAAGGWGDTQALTRIYQKAQPAGIAAAVNLG
jgi:integrase